MLRPAGRAALGLALAALLAPARGAAAEPLPSAFGPLGLGMPWAEAAAAGSFTELTRPTSDWERHVHACGYRSARFELEGASILATAQDGRITELSQATPVEPGSDVMRLAGHVIETFGQPQRATLRDRLGAVTNDRARANHALLEYRGAVIATFAVSGEPLWEYRVTVSDPDAGRLENLTIRCAREREGSAAKPGTS